MTPLYLTIKCAQSCFFSVLKTNLTVHYLGLMDVNFIKLLFCQINIDYTCLKQYELRQVPIEFLLTANVIIKFCATLSRPMTRN